ncbi:hypothetical protein ACFYO0_36855 [Streptomyces sp. NPDC006365]|uniref:hypothetical protein n=1 Tax=Streptomyces sp. NPDC006365 TaxID=3364744 RepID=UPI00367CBB91
MTRSPLCKKSSVPARVATALGFAIVALSLSAGVAAASAVEASPARHQEAVPADAAQALCERLTEVVAGTPVAEAVVPVCKLVNGWD